jgi:hypothetical protein
MGREGTRVKKRPQVEILARWDHQLAVEHLIEHYGRESHGAGFQPSWPLLPGHPSQGRCHITSAYAQGRGAPPGSIIVVIFVDITASGEMIHVSEPSRTVGNESS